MQWLVGIISCGKPTTTVDRLGRSISRVGPRPRLWHLSSRRLVRLSFSCLVPPWHVVDAFRYCHGSSSAFCGISNRPVLLGCPTPGMQPGHGGVGIAEMVRIDGNFGLVRVTM